MAEKKTKTPKAKKPETQEVYCVASHAMTSDGRKHHGDRVTLPKSEAEKLVAEGKFK